MLSTVRLALALTRPRFWPYILGPYVIGVVTSGNQDVSWPLILTWALFWTYPANYIIYGANDVFDYETDKRNPKKNSYEILVPLAAQKAVLQQVIGWSLVGFILAIISNDYSVLIAYGLFLFFGIGYSAPPVRAKARPIIDALFNTLYVFPGVIGYLLAANQLPSFTLFAAATAWCMAMHAFSAVPDIMADTKAGIRTVATLLGPRGTIVFCMICYGVAAILSAPSLGLFSLAAGMVYLGLMLTALSRMNVQSQLFKLYTWFPYINVAVGAILFWWIVLFVK